LRHAAAVRGELRPRRRLSRGHLFPSTSPPDCLLEVRGKDRRICTGTCVCVSGGSGQLRARVLVVSMWIVMVQRWGGLAGRGNL
jgi:hypothetical protein